MSQETVNVKIYTGDCQVNEFYSLPDIENVTYEGNVAGNTFPTGGISEATAVSGIEPDTVLRHQRGCFVRNLHLFCTMS